LLALEAIRDMPLAFLRVYGSRQ